MDAASVASTIRQKGQAMVITQKTIGEYDPISGGSFGVFPASYTVYGISSRFSWSEIANPNSSILKGDKKIMIEAGVVAPAIGSRITFVGADWTILSTEDVSPQGEVLFYYCHVRK